MSTIKGQHYGELISPEISKIVRDFTTRKDWVKTSKALGLSFSLAQRTIYRQIPLSVNGERIIKSLLKLVRDRAMDVPQMIENYLG